jgi:hypothetical protein
MVPRSIMVYYGGSVKMCGFVVTEKSRLARVHFKRKNYTHNIFGARRAGSREHPVMIPTTRFFAGFQ